MTISFRAASETTGSVADRTSKQETTGSVAARKNQESIFAVDNDLKQDTVCFRGAETAQAKKPSALKTLTGIVATAALLVGGLGLTHKYNLVDKITNQRAKDFFRHTDAVTEPCHKACSWVKRNCYDKVVNFFK